MGWSRIFAAIVATCAAFIAAPAQARWIEATSPNFILYSEGSEADLRRFAVLLEDYDQLLRWATGTKEPPSPNRLPIYMVRDGGLRIVRPGLPQDTAGFYTANSGSIAAFSSRAQGYGMDRDDVLFHEYAHHFMLQYYARDYPAWYVEGFAEYMMTANFTAKTIEYRRFNAGRAVSLVNQAWLPVERILDPKQGKRRTRQENWMFYAESWLIVHYLFSTSDRAKALNTYLDALADGKPAPEAFRSSFGMDFKAFDKALRGYMNSKITYTRMTRSSERAAPEVTLRTLPSSADKLLLLRAAMRLGVAENDQPRVLEAVRKEAADFPDDGLAITTLAQAEILLNDTPAGRAAGRALLDRLPAAERENAEVYYLRGIADLDDAQDADADKADELYRAARRMFTRAHKLDANYFPALYRYAQARLAVGPPDDNTLNVLLLARELAPQVGEIGLQAAAALMQRDRFKEAELILIAHAADPHGGDFSKAARSMLAMARASRKPGQFSTDLPDLNAAEESGDDQDAPEPTAADPAGKSGENGEPSPPRQSN